jgi:hypothetical protein
MTIASILVVENNRLTRKAVRVALRVEGHRAWDATTPARAPTVSTESEPRASSNRGQRVMARRTMCDRHRKERIYKLRGGELSSPRNTRGAVSTASAPSHGGTT